ncbi:hypothetical protein GGI15_003024 [Coemansia interrupta]|uniref:W2 domain-containing protein n=1 Tax=Coemansia interrupta TaxID=1126814 RepID=A0A9W8H9K2_9FUNG|nr:hypothetical protein GGI15_003024 [Coemansia interrupta]
MSTQVSNEKPTLNGVKIHARKRDAKASAKYEPEEFRTSIFQLIEPIAKDDFAKISATLDTAGNTLDYRRYGDTFFEILVTGGIIAPGGIIKNDDTRGKLPFSLFVLAGADADADADGGASSDDALARQIEQAKIWTRLITQLTRRYKYLERIFSETSVHVLENIHRYSDADNHVLAVGLGQLVSEGFLSMDPFRTLQKEHLTRDGIALRFMTDMLRVYLRANTAAQLNRALGKARIRQLTDFFPPAKRDADCFVRHFEAEDLPEIIELHNASQAVAQRDALVLDIVRTVREAHKDDDGEDDEAAAHAANVRVATLAQKAMRRNAWDEALTVALVWDGIMAAVDWPLRQDQIEALALAQIARHAEALEAFAATPKAEIALLKHVQMYCYSDAKLTKTFGRIVYALYSADALSDSAIIFWAAKGARAEGKADFIKQTETLVKKLEALAAEDSDDDEDSDEEDDE